MWLPSGNEFNTSLSVSWWTCVHIANISISIGASASSPEKSWATATSPLTLAETQMSSTSTGMSVLTGEHCFFCRSRKHVFIVEAVNWTSLARLKYPSVMRKSFASIFCKSQLSHDPSYFLCYCLICFFHFIGLQYFRSDLKNSICYFLHCKRDIWQLKFLKMCQLSITSHGHSAALCWSSLVGISMYLTCSYWLRTKLSIMLNKCNISLGQ